MTDLHICLHHLAVSPSRVGTLSSPSSTPEPSTLVGSLQTALCQDGHLLCVCGGGGSGTLPGLLYFAVFSSAPVGLNVALGAIDLTEIRVTDAQEVRPQAPDGHFGDVCEGLANGTAEKEASHLLIESRHIGVLNGGPGLLLQVIDPVEFPCDDLKGNQ